MKMRTVLAAILGIALAVPLAIAADPMTQKLSNLKGEQFSKNYAKHAIKHHQQGIEMAKLVQHHSQNRQLVQLAQQMVESQQREIEELKQLKSHHEGSASSSRHTQRGSGHSQHSGNSASESETSTTRNRPTGHTASQGSHHDMGGHADMEQMHRETMSRLESAQGQEFDRLFVEEMSKHHKMAIEMNDLAESRADGDLASFARKSAQQQQQELQQLQRLNSGKR